MTRVMYYNHYGEMGGAEISLLLTASHMPNASVILVAPEGSLLDAARKRSIPVVAVKSFTARIRKNILVLAIGAFGTWRAGMELRRLVKTYKPDIVHANSVRAGLIGMFATTRLPVKLVWHVRDQVPQSRIGWAIRKAAGYGTDAIITISEAIKESFSSSDNLSAITTVVHNGIEVQTTPKSLNIRKSLGIDNDKFVVGVVGQIALWKRQMDAVHAFYSFAQDHPDTYLLIVGEPRFRRENYEYEKQLRYIVGALGIGERVIFLGYRTDIPAIMNTLNVLLIPSNNEPFGRVVIEAMMAGVPVIGTDAGGIPEIIGRNQQAGILVPVGDVGSMTVALNKLFNDRQLIRTMGDRGKELVKTRFDIRVTCEKISKVYEELLNSPLVQEPKSEGLALPEAGNS